MLVKNLNLLTKEIILEGADKDFANFINWLFELAERNDDAGSLYAISATVKKIEGVKEKTIEGLKSVGSQTLNELLEKYNKKLSM